MYFDSVTEGRIRMVWWPCLRFALPHLSLALLSSWMPSAAVLRGSMSTAEVGVQMLDVQNYNESYFVAFAPENPSAEWRLVSCLACGHRKTRLKILRQYGVWLVAWPAGTGRSCLAAPLARLKTLRQYGVWLVALPTGTDGTPENFSAEWRLVSCLACGHRRYA